MTESSKPGELVPSRSGGMDLSESEMDRLAEELVVSATDRGVQLTGEGGLLTTLTRRVLPSALEVEMAHHLGYDKHDPAGRGSPNSRNGTTPKTVKTEIGQPLRRLSVSPEPDSRDPQVVLNALLGYGNLEKPTADVPVNSLSDGQFLSSRATGIDGNGPR